MNIHGAVKPSWTARSDPIFGNGFQSDFLDPFVFGHAQEVQTRGVDAFLIKRLGVRWRVGERVKELRDMREKENQWTLLKIDRAIRRSSLHEERENSLVKVHYN